MSSSGSRRSSSDNGGRETTATNPERHLRVKTIGDRPTLILQSSNSQNMNQSIIPIHTLEYQGHSTAGEHNIHTYMLNGSPLVIRETDYIYNTVTYAHGGISVYHRFDSDPGLDEDRNPLQEVLNTLHAHLTEGDPHNAHHTASDPVARSSSSRRSRRRSSSGSRRGAGAGAGGGAAAGRRQQGGRRRTRRTRRHHK